MNHKKIVFMIAWMISSYLIAATLLLNESFGDYLLDRHSEKPSEAKNNFHKLLLFFKSTDNAGFVEFTSDENNHMQDVRSVLRLLFLTLAISVAIILSLFRKEYLNHASLTAIIIPLLITLIPFESVFNIFHQIFFPQGNWSFAPGSTIISYYTESFFQAYAFWIALLGMSLNLLILTIKNLPMLAKNFLSTPSKAKKH